MRNPCNPVRSGSEWSPGHYDPKLPLPPSHRAARLRDPLPWYWRTVQAGTTTAEGCLLSAASEGAPGAIPAISPRPINFSCTADRPAHPLAFRLLVLASGSPFVFLSSLFWSYASRRRARGARPSEVRSCGAPFASPSWAPSGISSCFAPIRAYTQARRPLLHALRGWGGTGVPDLSQPIKLCPPSERHFRLLLYR